MRYPTIGLTLAATALLAGCNLNKDNDNVRPGPQAVHPSTSALAQEAAPRVHRVGGAVVVMEPRATATYVPQPGDGSQPIID
jgi:hypothetical protein